MSQSEKCDWVNGCDRWAVCFAMVRMRGGPTPILRCYEHMYLARKIYGDQYIQMISYEQVCMIKIHES